MTNRKLAYIVKDQKPLVLAAHETVQHACQCMRECRIGSVLVVDDQQRLSGIFTGRDAVRTLAEGKDAAVTTLAQAMTPNALAEHFDTTRQAVSKHLRILTECELVKQDYQGREIYYQLEINKMKEIDKWLEQFRKIWEDRFNQLDKVLLKLKPNKK